MSDPEYASLPLSLVVERLRPEHGGHVLKGVVEILGVGHHVEFLRVGAGAEVWPLPEAPPEVHAQFDALQRFYDGDYDTVAVPGFPGRYVLVIFPFCH